MKTLIKGDAVEVLNTEGKVITQGRIHSIDNQGWVVYVVLVDGTIKQIPYQFLKRKEFNETIKQT